MRTDIQADRTTRYQHKMLETYEARMAANQTSELRCSRCKNLKPVSEFSPDRRKKRGYHSSCKACCCAYAKSRPTVIGKMLGLTSNKFQLMLENQKFVCALCSQSEKSKRRMSVDHDHKTGKLRAILCTKCNTGLGAFNDDPKLLKRAISYLKKHTERAG